MLYAEQYLDWHLDPADNDDDDDDDVCILPLITANDNSVIAKEVTFEGEYLPPALELPVADFGLLLEEEQEAAGQYWMFAESKDANPPTTRLRKSAGATPLEKPAHSCTSCALHFQCKSQLMRHQLLWHVETLDSNARCINNRCNKCDEKFPSAQQLASHLAAQHPQIAVCNLCLTTFHDESTLKWHRKHHQLLLPTTEKSASIRPCRYVCDFCQKHCASSSHLHLHRKVHLEQKAYACEHCGRTFSSSGNRQKHIARVHTLERKYRCPQCDESFIYPRQLKLHQDRKHANLGDQIPATEHGTVCPCCRTAFPSATDLRQHQKVGHCREQRSFVCGHCTKRFKQATHLRNHLHTHTGERAHECEFCDKRFAMAGDLRVHRRIHTKEKPFRCELCPAAFIMGKQLNKHRSAAHGT